MHGKTTLSPCLDVFFRVQHNGLFSFSEEVLMWMFQYWEGQASQGLVNGFLTPGQVSVEFVNVGGWLTYGDIGFGFLCSVPWRLLSTG